MFESLTVTLLAALISLLGGAVASIPVVKELVQTLIGGDHDDEPSYSDRLRELTRRLEESSSEVDHVLREIGEVATQRQSRVEELERSLSTLSEQEANAKARIDALENVPLEAVEHFAGLVASSDKRGARRDYLLFASGVVASAVVGLLINFLG